MSPEIDRPFSTRDVMRLCRVTRRQLQYWRDERVIRPLFDGHDCVYSRYDVRKARLVRELIAKGLRCAELRRILPRLAEYNTGYLLIEGDRRKTHYALTQQEALKLAVKAKGVLLVDLGAAA